MASTETEVSELGAEIGTRVRRYREAAGMSGVKLAAASGVSQPFLSQLESGRTSVAITTLYRLAHALGVHPADLLPTPPELDFEVVRSTDRQHMVASEHLHSASARAIFRSGGRITELYDFDIRPDEHFTDDWFTNRAESAVYILEGRLRFEVEGRQPIVLEAGDAVFYNSRTPHRWGPEPGSGARVILVVSNDQPADG